MAERAPLTIASLTERLTSIRADGYVPTTIQLGLRQQLEVAAMFLDSPQTHVSPKDDVGEELLGVPVERVPQEDWFRVVARRRNG